MQLHGMSILYTIAQKVSKFRPALDALHRIDAQARDKPFEGSDFITWL
jgi:hypothetical protein